MRTYEIISTGSKGNAVVIDSKILIDCGVPFKRLAPFAPRLLAVLLTHVHGDHFNRTTVRKLAAERPALRFVAPPWMIGELPYLGIEAGRIDIAWLDSPLAYHGSDLALEAFTLPHNVPNCGYKIHFPDWRMIYATDTSSLSHVSAPNYDLYMIEGNYSRESIRQRIRDKQEAGEYCHEWDALNNHLSVEDATDWLYRNMGANSVYVYMHGHGDGEDVMGW